MNQFKPLKLALAIILCGGLTMGCSNNSTRSSEAVEPEERELLSMKKDADVENRSGDKAAVLPTAKNAEPQAQVPSQTQNQPVATAEPQPSPTTQKAMNKDETIQFEFDSAELTGGAKRILDRLADSADEVQNINSISIAGYADATGSDDYNEQLSRKRAESVQSYLREKGVEARDWNIEGRGEQDPVASNDSSEGRSENRRVVIEISGLGENQGLTYDAD